MKMLKMIGTIVLVVILSAAVSAKSVKIMKKSMRMEKPVIELDTDSIASQSDWDSEVKQITIEKKVPVFIEKIRHVPVPIVQKEYIEVPRYITKPFYFERSLPIIIPRTYHHHHYSEYHHMG